MNWNDLKNKASPYLERVNPYIEKGKTYGAKAIDFTQKQLQNTPIVLKNVSEYESILALSKRFILMAYTEEDAPSQEMLLWSPVWSTLAWSDNASIRFFSVQSAPEIAQHLGVNTSVDMRVYYGWGETWHFTDVESIKKWWKDRCYLKEWNSDDLKW